MPLVLAGYPAYIRSVDISADRSSGPAEPAFADVYLQNLDTTGLTSSRTIHVANFVKDYAYGYWHR